MLPASFAVELQMAKPMGTAPMGIVLMGRAMGMLMGRAMGMLMGRALDMPIDTPVMSKMLSMLGVRLAA